MIWKCNFILGHARMCVLNCFSRVWLFLSLWTVILQAALSMGFSRQEYWSGFPYSPPGDLLYPGNEPTSPAATELHADSLLLRHQEYMLRKHSSYKVHMPQCKALFTLTRTWKQPKYPSTEKWIKKKWYMYAMEYYLAT